MILLPFRVTSTHSVTFYTFWGSSWGVPSTWRAPQRHQGPRTSPQTRLQWLTRQVGVLAKSPPLCPCERETQTLNHWLLSQLWLCCCSCSVSLFPRRPPLCMFISHAQALGGPGWPWVALGGWGWHCSPCLLLSAGPHCIPWQPFLFSMQAPSTSFTVAVPSFSHSSYPPGLFCFCGTWAN